MGSFINIGLASKKTMIKESIMGFFKRLNGFAFYKVYYPQNNYDEWASFSDEKCSIEETVDYCLIYEMAYFIGEFTLDNKRLNNVEFTVEKKDDVACLIIKMPDEELIKDIDGIECCVIEFLKKIEGFSFAFCDSEAHLDDDKYSIYVQYLDKPVFTYEGWKIDGLTERSMDNN